METKDHYVTVIESRPLATTQIPKAHVPKYYFEMVRDCLPFFFKTSFPFHYFNTGYSKSGFAFSMPVLFFCRKIKIFTNTGFNLLQFLRRRRFKKKYDIKGMNVKFMSYFPPF